MSRDQEYEDERLRAEADYTELLAQRDDLLTALKQLLGYILDAAKQARAAIARAKGENA